MITTARTQLTQKGMIDKFELICADIYDDNLTLPEKVDVVLLVNTVTTFISSYEMLQQLYIQARKLAKEKDGVLFIYDFSYIPIPNENFYFGMATETFEQGKAPKEFEPFKFIIP